MTMTKYKLLESWKPVVGYEGLYEVSSFGRVIARRKSRRHKDVILRGHINSSTGYRQVVISKKGHKKAHKVARLVAQAFIPNPEGKRTVNHKDFNRKNDYLCNLEWMTQSENIRHSFTRPRKVGGAKGEKHGCAKFTNETVLEIRRLYEAGVKQIDIAKKFNTSNTYIWSIVHRHNWKHI